MAALYERTGHLVLRRCRFVLGDAAEAEDVMQEVYIRALRYGGSFRGRTVPLSWLYRTAERCCFDRLRKRSREPLRDEDDLALLPLPVDTRADREAADLVLRFFHALSPRLMQVALLTYVDGLPQREVAAQLGWSRRTVGKKLKKLRERAARLARAAGGLP